MIKGGSPRKSRSTVPVKSPYLYDMIQELGLNDRLVFTFDAADPRSFSRSNGQYILDPSQSFKQIFTRGDDETADTTDPTFVGSIGLADEDTYFEFDGAQNINAFASRIPDTAKFCHDNAKVSLLIMWYTGGATSSDAMFACDDVSAVSNQWTIWLNVSGSNDLMVFRHMTDNGGSIATENSTLPIRRTAWNMLGVDFDDTETDVYFIVNKDWEKLNTTASTRTTINATYNTQIGVDIGGNFVPADSRVACIAVWESSIGLVAFRDLYSLLKSRRFPSLP